MESELNSLQVSAISNLKPTAGPSSRHYLYNNNDHSHGNQRDPDPATTSVVGNSSPPYVDAYSHPKAVAYAAAHPRRIIPKFGPYLVLQRLGEGESAKFRRLGLHIQWGEEVAIKLIRRADADNSAKLSKVEREIEVLRGIKHPNVVRLFDVIETDKYIGIILEYANGGELFDHILTLRYLPESRATRLFSQLISTVWYLHQKKIVHRNLNLRNVLLDRHGNMLIAGFGSANRFEHRADDLMQTICGSPCYAAPELVLSEGLYVGSAVDVWSCGIILYAMLAGYLPFSDDPSNPDGDNINRLYIYIVSTPLSFPDYISAEARDLLSMMLVPNPTRRATLDDVMKHPWLSAYRGEVRKDEVPNAFGKSVEELERQATEQLQQKGLAYWRQMRANVDARARVSNDAQPIGLSPYPVTAPAGTKGHNDNVTGDRGGGIRHTIQVEYDEPMGRSSSNSIRPQQHRLEYVSSQPLQALQSHYAQPEFLYNPFMDGEGRDRRQNVFGTSVERQAMEETEQEEGQEFVANWDTLSANESLYSLASSRTASTNYGIYCRRLALSQETFADWDE